MLAQTGAYSIVQIAHAHAFHGLAPAPWSPVPALHSPLIYARSSHTVPSDSVHIPTWPPSDEVTSASVPPFL